MTRPVMFAWSLCLLLFAAWIASFTVVSQYELHIRMQDTKHQVAERLVTHLTLKVDSLNTIIARRPVTESTINQQVNRLNKRTINLLYKINAELHLENDSLADVVNRLKYHD